MAIEIDHVVLWVEDPLRAVTFYEEVVGLQGVRVEEFKEKKAPFPSVRLSEHALLDLAPKSFAAVVNGMARKIGVTQDAAGTPTNHVCLAMNKVAFEALRDRLKAANVPQFALKDSFGARGEAPASFYFVDPDGNVLEARHYGDE